MPETINTPTRCIKETSLPHASRFKSFCSHIAWVTTLVAFLVIPAPAASQTLDEVIAQLQEPVVIWTQDRRQFKGQGQNFSPDSFQLRAREGIGEVEYTLRADNIATIIFPGEEAHTLIADLINKEQHEQALQLFAALFRQQANFFPYLSEQQIHYFSRYADLAMESGDYIQAIAVAKKMKPFLQNPFAVAHATDTMLLGYFRLNIADEVESHVNAWLNEAKPYHYSALGWWVKAQTHFDKQNYEATLWTSLYPITFSSQVPMPYLESCYTLAIASALALKNETQARQLYTEMQTRGFEWAEQLEGVEPAWQQLNQLFTSTSTAPLTPMPDETAPKDTTSNTNVKAETPKAEEPPPPQKNKLPTRTF